MSLQGLEVPVDIIVHETSFLKLNYVPDTNFKADGILWGSIPWESLEVAWVWHYSRHILECKWFKAWKCWKLRMSAAQMSPFRCRLWRKSSNEDFTSTQLLPFRWFFIPWLAPSRSHRPSCLFSKLGAPDSQGFFLGLPLFSDCFGILYILPFYSSIQKLPSLPFANGSSFWTIKWILLIHSNLNRNCY